jgi:hypothetical protein
VGGVDAHEVSSSSHTHPPSTSAVLTVNTPRIAHSFIMSPQVQLSVDHLRFSTGHGLPLSADSQPGYVQYTEHMTCDVETCYMHTLRIRHVFNAHTTIWLHACK